MTDRRPTHVRRSQSRRLSVLWQPYGAPLDSTKLSKARIARRVFTIKNHGWKFQVPDMAHLLGAASLVRGEVSDPDL